MVFNTPSISLEMGKGYSDRTILLDLFLERSRILFKRLIRWIDETLRWPNIIV